jgi:hypothetical protein
MVGFVIERRRLPGALSLKLKPLSSQLSEVYPMTLHSEILFPCKAIPAVANLRGPEWQKLVAQVMALPDTHEDRLAFCLMMVRLSECMKCDLGSYKASLGCGSCARRAINSAKLTDAALLKRFEKARVEVLEYLRKREEKQQAA